MSAVRVEFTQAEWDQISTATPLVGRRVVYRTAAPTGPRGAPGVAGGSAIVKEGGTVVSSAVTTFDFGAGFDVAESPAGEVNISLDLTEVPAASDTAQGPVELATVAEATTGTDTARATTPAGVKAAVDAGIAALIASAPGALDTLEELAAALGDDANFAATITAALAGKQPLDSDLTSIAALTTTSFGRSLLELANAAALRTAAALGTAATAASSEFATAAQGLSETLVVAIGDETTAITTGTAKVTFRMPWAFTLTAVRASLTTASSSGTPTFDINEGGVSILSTKLTIDANERTSTTAATAAVISDASLADDAEITIDVDVAGTNAAGAKITLIGTRA